jgi:hypothetical protein
MTPRLLLAAGMALSIAASSSVALHAQADMSAGRWELNVAKSSSTGALPKSQTRTWEVSGQSVKYTMKGLDAQGKPQAVSYAAAYDGKDYPITGDANSDTIALTRVDERTVRITQKRAGKVASTSTRTMTISTSGTTAAGQPLKSTMVLERR